MKSLPRTIIQGVSRSPGSWLTLLLLGVVLVPSISLLWFVNQAVQNERLAVRQKFVEAYRGYLVLAQERLQSHWRQYAGQLATLAEKQSAPALFAQQIQQGSADAVVCFDLNGKVIYPDFAPPPVIETSNAEWTRLKNLEARDPNAAAGAYARFAEQSADPNLAARALQAQARCLLRTDHAAAAIFLLTGPLAESRFRTATDHQGRLIQPNADLLALELLKDSAPARSGAIRMRLKMRLLDPEDKVMTAPQRRFLMRQLEKLAPGLPPFPTLAGDDLATAWIATRSAEARGPILRASSLAEVWQFASQEGRVLTLHRTSSLLSRIRTVVSQPEGTAGVRVDFSLPGHEIEGSLLSLPVGDTMPGWRLALTLQDQRLFDAATNQRVNLYLWIGGLVVVTVVVLAVLGWGLVRRQIALTQLRNDLVANVTHELKTPLASTRLLVDTLLRTPQLHEPTTREYLQLIASENLRLSRLIDNFLTFSRIERNKYAFSFQHTPATAIAKNAVAAVRDRFQGPGLRFDVTIPADLPPVTADADALTTALVNLLENAWKYSGDTKEITLTAHAQNGRVIFAVRDNGIGLSPRDQKQIFQRFYQVNQHLSPTGGGCGLGLSIVQFIVSAHGGRVQVESELGHGSTFTLDLPAAGTPESPVIKP